MSRNLVVCCDGTGNIWGNDCDTNVVKLVRIIQKNEQQILFYDPGVGTSDTYPSIGKISRAKARAKEIVGLAIGGGIYENIGQAYGFLVEHYQPTDRVFIFGFSRGAFTARCVAGMINLFGIVRRGAEAMIPSLTRIYFQPIEGTGRTGSTRQDYGDDIRAVFTLEGRDARVYFLGVWDTVSTVGGLPGSKKNITSYGTISGKNYDHVRHAVASHEYRYAYEPRLFKDNNFDHGRTSLKQLRFAGAHSDVGGSYKESGLSNCSLKWMVEEAIEKGLLCDLAKVNSIEIDPLGLAHDQAFSQPLWALSGLRTRLSVLGVEPHWSFSEREKAKNIKAVWKPLRKNLSALSWISGTLVMLFVVQLLSYWACSMPCDYQFNPSDLFRHEFNMALFFDVIRGDGIENLFGTVNASRMIKRYLADYLFILAYSGAVCWLLVYGRRIVAELTTKPVLHRAAHWSSLIPLWILIGSDVVENTLTLYLLNEPVGAYRTHDVILWLTAGLTGTKLLALLMLCCHFICLGAWALIARIIHKPNVVKRGSSIPT